MFYSINDRAITASEIASLVPRLLPMKKMGGTWVKCDNYKAVFSAVRLVALLKVIKM